MTKTPLSEKKTNLKQSLYSLNDESLFDLYETPD